MISSLIPARWTHSRRIKNTASVLLSLALGIGIWQAVAEARWVSPLFLPSFSSVISTLWDQLTSGALNHDLVVSGVPFFIGLGLAVVVGSAIGFLMGLVPPVRTLLMPWVMSFNSVPRVALIPMIIIICGIGTENHVVVVLITAVVPMILNVAAGSANVDMGLKRMAKSFHVTRRHTLALMVVPWTVPYIVSGLRIALGQALIGIVVAEFFVSSAGIGHVLFAAGQQFETVEVYALMILIALVGIILSQMLGVLDRRLEAWRRP